MLERMKRTLTYANVMSTIAVFGVLGGGAYAAAQIGPSDIKRNAVRSKHIKKNQVGRKHLKRKAVSGAKLAGGAVTEAKLATGAVTEPKIADAAVTGAKVNESTLDDGAERRPVDGVDAADLLRGRGDTARSGEQTPPVARNRRRLRWRATGEFTLGCQNPASVGSEFKFTNTSGSTADVWTDKVQDSFAIGHQIFYQSVPNGGNASVMVSGPVVSDGRSLVKFTIA